ncbi:MAG: formylmethanofuran--tetrahydromethanopterin N-formyltransferase, partial [Methanosarcina thermophila]
IAGRKMHKIPIMEGDYLNEENIGAVDGIAGGNFFIFGDSQMSALTAAEAAVDAISELEGTITPFPGGIVSSGSKSGANKYKFLKATANEKFCPSIKDKIENTEVPADVNAIYEIVINGLDEESIKAAMKAGIKAAVTVPGIKRISAGNYGGKLGKYQFKLHELF